MPIKVPAKCTRAGSSAGPGRCPGSLSRLPGAAFPAAQLFCPGAQRSVLSSAAPSEATIDPCRALIGDRPGAPEPPPAPAPQLRLPRALRGERAPEGARGISWGKERVHLLPVVLFDAISAQGLFTASPGLGAEPGQEGAMRARSCSTLAVFTPNKPRRRGLALTLKAGAGAGPRGSRRGGRAGPGCGGGSALPRSPGPPPSPWRTRAPGEVSAERDRPARPRPAGHRGRARPEFLPRAPGSSRAGRAGLEPPLSTRGPLGSGRCSSVPGQG